MAWLGVVFRGHGDDGIDGYSSSHPCACTDRLFACHGRTSGLYLQYGVSRLDGIEGTEKIITPNARVSERMAPRYCSIADL